MTVLLAACNNDGTAAPPASDPTVPTLAPTTTTTNPYAVPAVIDAAYVNRVLAGLDAAVGDIVRLVVRTKAIPREAIEQLKATYLDQQLLQLQIDSFQTDLRGGLQGYRAEPGNARTTVTELITALQSCIYVKVNRDVSAVATSSDPRLGTQWIAIRHTSSPGSFNFNPTGWGYVYEGFQRNLTAPTVNPCTGI